MHFPLRPLLTFQFSASENSTHLLGEEGVCRDMEGTPVVGVM